MHQKIRTLSGLDGCIHTKSNQHGNCLKTKSRAVAKGFFQPYTSTSVHKNDSRSCERERFAIFTPRSISGVCAGIPRGANLHASSPALHELSGKIVKLLKCRYSLKQVGRE